MSTAPGGAHSARAPETWSGISFRYSGSARVMDSAGRRLKWEHKVRAIRGDVVHVGDKRVWLSNVVELLGSGEKRLPDTSYALRRMSHVVHDEAPAGASDAGSADDGAADVDGFYE